MERTPHDASPSTPWGLATIVARVAVSHVGGSVTSVALEQELARRGALPWQDFQVCYAASRLTPGTNLLALFAAVGARLHAWRGAVLALLAGSLPPALLTVAAAWLYTRAGSESPLTGALRGVAVAGIVVIAWAALALIRPLAAGHGLRAPVVALAVAAATLVLPVHPLALILVGAAAGALWLR